MSSLINVTSDAYTESEIAENWAGEYARRSICEHKESAILDHPNGCVTSEKLSDDLHEIISYATEVSETAKVTADSAAAIANSAKTIAELTKKEVVEKCDAAYIKAVSAISATQEMQKKVGSIENVVISMDSDAESMRVEMESLSDRLENAELMLGDVDAVCDTIINIQNNLMGVSV